MDQIEIGKFISKERKSKKMTQRQLGDILGISDKTISKWECGNGFPEVSLLLPLCNELGITVNELLSGARLSEVDYQKKAEENIMNLIHEKEVNRQKTILTASIGVVSFLSFIALISIVTMYTDVIHLRDKIILIVIALAIFLTGFYFIMHGERTIGYYKCKHCGETFIPDSFSSISAMKLGLSKHLKCPHCHKKSFCKKVLSKEDK